MAEQEAAFCPSCNKPAIRQGKVIVCEQCDASFRFTQEGPKLHEIGPLESRLKTVEAKLGIGGDGKIEPPAVVEETEEVDRIEEDSQTEDNEEDF